MHALIDSDVAAPRGLLFELIRQTSDTRVTMKTNFQSNAPLDALRAFARYQTHGGYVWGAVCSDGALLCETCVRENYRQIFRETRGPKGGSGNYQSYNSNWRIIGLANSGEHDSDSGPECAPIAIESSGETQNEVLLT